MKKRVLAGILAALMILPMTACGNQDTGSGESGAAYVLNVASADGTGGIAHQGLQKFEQYVEENSNGQIDVVIHMDGVLGGEREALEGMKLGTVQAVCAGTASFSAYDERISVVNLPFMFPDFSSFEAAMKGDVGAELTKFLADKDIAALGYYASGLRIMGNNIRPIHTVDDLKGIKMRVPEQDVFIKMFKAMGANPTPMAWTEIYTGLQQGTIDGMECSPSAIYDSKLHEPLTYMTVTNHSIDTCLLAISPSWMSTLPENLQQVIIDGGAECADWMNETFDSESADVLKKFEEAGKEVVYLTEEERATFVDAVSSVYDEYKDVFGQDLIDLCFSYSA